MDSWLHDSHATALLGSAMLDPSQPYIYPPISIHLHLPPAFSSERPGRDAHYLFPSCSPLIRSPDPKRLLSRHTLFLRSLPCVAFSYAPRALVHFSGSSRCSPQPHAHTRRRLESALTSSQVGAGVAPSSRPEFITCAQPVWPGWNVQPESSSGYMPDLVKLMPSELTTSLQRATEEAADVIARRLHALFDLSAQALLQLLPPSARKYCEGSM